MMFGFTGDANERVAKELRGVGYSANSSTKQNKNLRNLSPKKVYNGMRERKK